jgi:hypothetical protein
MLGAAFSFVALGFGGAGGLINMSYQLDSTIHNTQWITGHFQLIFGGAIVIMYFVITYDIWPHLTGRALNSVRLTRVQLWTWFVGMIVLTFPWQYVGILGMPRRMAFHDYKDPMIAAQAGSVTMAVIGGATLVVSGALFLVVLARGQAAPRAEPGAYRFGVAARPPRTEWLRALVQPDGGAYHCELRLPSCSSFGDPRHRGAGNHGRSPAMSWKWITSFGISWIIGSVGITAAIAVAGAIAGFAWLPLEQPGERIRGVWDAICSAAGLVQLVDFQTGARTSAQRRARNDTRGNRCRKPVLRGPSVGRQDSQSICLRHRARAGAVPTTGWIGSS